MANALLIKWTVSFRWLAFSALLTLGFCARTQAQTKPLVLISQPDSTRAIAFESVTFTREPFPLNSLISWSQDRRTRVLIFALNLHLQPGEGPSNVAADAEDATHRHYNLTVESVGSVPGQQWLTELNLRLSDDIGEVGDVLVRITHNSQSSNRVRIALGHAGGGLPDDPGSEPTPAPPYPISGRVIADGVGLPSITVTFIGPASGTTTTDAQGNYSILAPEPGDYVISMAEPFYEFSPPSLTLVKLSNRRNDIDFTRSRQRRTIEGQVKDESGQAFPNLQVTLTGGQPAITQVATTDTAGSFAFPDLQAGFNYAVSVSQEDYVFEPLSVAFSQLDANGRADFRGTPHVTVGGRILDGSGRGIAGVKVGWSGSQSGTTSTRIDGTYSFLVTAFGTYTLTPSKEQDYYSYAPASASVTPSGNRVADFTATLNASVSPSFVLEFDGAPKTVDYSIPHFPSDSNLFWPDGLDLGHFFWEFWAMPGDNAGATYMISDGWGGAHAILFGVANLGAREPGRYQLLGNIWNGSDLTYFASDEGPAPHEWGHYAAGWDGNYLVIYFNGVPVGKTAFTGPRITPGGSQGCGRLLIGGSDHSNFIGRIAQVRGYETYNPREDAGIVYASAAPETVFSVDGSLLSYFFRPSENIADLSLYGQYGRQHAGLLHDTINGVPFPCAGCPLPQFVIDATAPDFAHPEAPGQPPAPVDNPAAVPSGALVFDSFSKRNSTYALSGTGGLSATEGGTLGPRNWLSGVISGLPQPFGILNGRVVILSNGAAVTWVSIPSPHSGLDIRVDRHAGFWGSGQNTAISFRVADARNYFFAYSSEGADTAQPKKLTVGYYSDGLRTDLATGVVMPADWTTMRVVTTTAGVVSVYANGTLLYTTNHSFLSSSTGAGLYNNGPGLGLTNRWDNFAVFETP